MQIIRKYGPLLIFTYLLNSCAAFKPQSPAVSSTEKKNSPFLENISVKPEAAKTGSSAEMPTLADNSAKPMNFNTGITINEAATTQFRYSIILNTEVEYLTNKALYDLIDDWWGTPYKIGGMTKRGIDCSAFTQNLMAAVYQLTLPRTASEQKALCGAIPKDELTEGDLVFFNTRGGVSHVGVYLQNNKFVHASTSGGVTISDLDEPYWKKRFIAAGRPLK